MYAGKGAWFFLTLPQDLSKEIQFLSRGKRRGWGSVRVSAKIGKSSWETSIFPDSKAGAYLLPVKAEIRKKEGLRAGSRPAVILVVQLL